MLKSDSSKLIKEKSQIDICVIGGGVIGSTTALYLANLGYEIALIDSSIDKRNELETSRTGTQASLGVLMGYISRRQKGRSWELRKRSMELWPELIQELKTKEYPLKIETPLIQLASSTLEAEAIQKLIHERSKLGISSLEEYDNDLKDLNLPNSNFGGLLSQKDGRIDPRLFMNSIMNRLDSLKVIKIRKNVNNIQKIESVNSYRWAITLNNNLIKTNYIIICAGLHSEGLLQSLGHNISLDPILGQAIEIKISEESLPNIKWPAVVNTNGINLISTKCNNMLIGATLEPGLIPSANDLRKMKSINGSAPKWLKNSTIINKWNGIRARPNQSPAPLIKQLEKGLIINTGHYRNGILLAPACAEWVASKVKKEKSLLNKL